MDWDIDVLLNQEVIDSFHVLIFSCVSCAHDSADTNGVLVAEIYTFLRIDDVPILCAEAVLQ
jgi:coenzyme F420-reducing hydrogenase delta subunit